jgi:Family of unknown function (DUF6074)
MSQALACPAAYLANGGGGGGIPKRPSGGPADVIPFPMAHRVAFLDRAAEVAASYRDPKRYLANVYRQQEQSLRRRGFSDDVVQSEMAALAQAIEARLAEYEAVS